MSRPIFSAAAAVTVDVVVTPPRPAQHLGSCELEPGLRIIEGRVLYSAAWLDQGAGASRTAEAQARAKGRSKRGLGG